MIKSSEIFDSYQNHLKKYKDVKEIFTESGMINEFNKLDFGFFPIGSGVLKHGVKKEIASISHCKIMILGNDFGTLDYLENKCPNNSERESNPTIKNLINELKLDVGTTFFTNVYLGVRKEGTNIKRMSALQKSYKKFCQEFLDIQLNILMPEYVICLGHEVRRALIDYSEEFHIWKSKPLKKIYELNQETVSVTLSNGTRKFIVIPHPCDTRNFNNFYISKVLEIII